MRESTVLIIGASSEIGIAIAYEYASVGYHVQLACREAKRLEQKKSDIELRYQVKVQIFEFDVLTIQDHDIFVEKLNPTPDIAVSCVGYMGDGKKYDRYCDDASLIVRSNFEGPLIFLLVLSRKFMERKSGTIVGISSVAGDRGRANNKIYGASKSGFTAFLSGLRNSLFKSNVHVVTVIPGYVNTKMIRDINPPKFLVSEPKDVAIAIRKAVTKKTNIIYVGNVWKIIMSIIKIIPESIFKRMSI